MEAGFLNHSITPHDGLLIKKTTVERKLEIRIPKFVWNSDNPDSNLKKLNFAFNFNFNSKHSDPEIQKKEQSTRNY